jgi:anti-sigma28 factor (negative regulator of flagellin synthesis)
MKLSSTTSGVPNTNLVSPADIAKDPAGGLRASEPAKSNLAMATGASAQVDLRSSRINDLSDASWINEPPALDTAMLDQIKSAIREGRFVINEQAIARALSEDASR